MFRVFVHACVWLLALAPFTVGHTARIDAGASTSCAIVDGGVRCWGDNFYGALGNPAYENSALAVDVVGFEPGAGKMATAVATRGGSSCAVAAGGVVCWGENAQFQLGNGTNDRKLTATAVSGLAPATGRNVTAVALGAQHACALESGGVWCWGNNEDGRLGDGTTITRPTPVMVSGLEPGAGKGVVAIAAGYQHTCAAGLFGIKCWGRNDHAAFGATHTSAIPLLIPNLPGPISVLDIADLTTCLVSGGVLKCWGKGPLGDGNDGSSNSPVTVPFLPTPITHVSIGETNSDLEHHICAIASGIAYCWGNDRYGQLGDGAFQKQLLPVAVQDFDASAGGAALEMASGEIHSCGLHSTQGLRCWGGIALGLTGDGSYARQAAPVSVAAPAGSGATRIASAGEHTCAVIASKVWCWGGNRDGELGDGSTSMRAAPVMVSNSSMATAVGVGAHHSCAIQSGQVWCWGQNFWGQLGRDPSMLSRSTTPVQVTGLPSMTQVASGPADHSCAISTLGALYCWGYNAHGQTGSANPDGSANQSEPWKPRMVFASGVTSVATGASHTCAAVDGGVACWGSDLAGELGNGAATGGPLPSEVFPPGTGATLVATGVFYSCAVLNGGARCWGVDYATLASGNIAFSDTPQPVGLPAGSGVTSISTSTHTTCALVAGAPKCWGEGVYGALGTGDFNPHPEPSPVQGLANASAITTAGSHTCAIVSGAVRCWGWTMDGRLGTQSTGTRTAPVPVLASALFRSSFE